MSAQSKFGPGYVYAVAAGTAMTAVKLGLTRKADPAEYCRQNYGRVLCPLNILRIVKVPNAGLAELMLFEALKSCRVSVAREVFDLTQDPGCLTPGFAAMKCALDALHSGDAGVEECSVEAFGAGSPRNLRAGRISAAEARRVRREARRELRASEETQVLSVKHVQKERLETLVGTFLRENCRLGPDRLVSSADLLAAFKAWSGGEPLSSQGLVAMLKSRGLSKKKSRVDTHEGSVNCFIGVGLLPQQADRIGLGEHGTGLATTEDLW